MELLILYTGLNAPILDQGVTAGFHECLRDPGTIVGVSHEKRR